MTRDEARHHAKALLFAYVGNFNPADELKGEPIPLLDRRAIADEAAALVDRLRLCIDACSRELAELEMY